MMSALAKVETSLSERYITKCVHCDWVRQFFGTAVEARQSALRMGWEFRQGYVMNGRDPDVTPIERAFCPHCQLLVKKEPTL